MEFIGPIKPAKLLDLLKWTSRDLEFAIGHELQISNEERLFEKFLLKISMLKERVDLQVETSYSGHVSTVANFPTLTIKIRSNALWKTSL